jgi:hypothetical protein
MHVEGMAVNNQIRRHHPNVRSGSGHDLFYKLSPNRFRLWAKDSDPAPLYKEDIEALDKQEPDISVDGDELHPTATREFAFERDLRNYLVRNLSLIEHRFPLTIPNGHPF